MDIDRIYDNEKQLIALTSLTRAELDEILKGFETELKNLGRLNSKKGGRPAKLGLKGTFLMLMMYYRHYLPLEALGALFDLDDSNVKRWFDDAETALKRILEKKDLLHLIAPKIEKKQQKNWSRSQKSISMALNSLYGDKKTT